MYSSNGVPALEIVQLEMHLAFADLVAESFEVVIRKGLEEVGGGKTILNLRLDEDPDYQRVAGVVVGEGHVALVFLARNGQSVVVEPAATSRHPMAEIVLARAGEDSAGESGPETPPGVNLYVSRIRRRN